MKNYLVGKDLNGNMKLDKCLDEIPIFKKDFFFQNSSICMIAKLLSYLETALAGLFPGTVPKF